MPNIKFNINDLRVAKPCPVAWETMKGDDRSRHCDSCGLNVFNISGMSATEAESLIQTRQGRLCIRLFRRTDGTVLTADCPVGLRSARKRIAKFAGAAFAAVLGLFSVSFAQEKDKDTTITKTKIERSVVIDGKGVLHGTVVDMQGAVIASATVRLYRGDYSNTVKTNEVLTDVQSDSEGHYSFAVSEPGKYFIEVLVPGFKRAIVANIEIGKEESLKMDVEMEAGAMTGTVGVLIGLEPLLETTTPQLITSISGRKLTDLPHPKR